jgi:superfamily II DNA or RNA helicase
MKRGSTKGAARKPVPTIFTQEYKTEVASKSYLGKRGYTIPKSCLTKEDLDQIYKDLLLKPVIIGVNYGQEKEAAFPVYRENTNKIYIPRFYGIERYGFPGKSEITIGAPIDLVFEKPLRDYQEKIIAVYMNHVATANGNGGILEVPCGRGKTVMALKILSLLKTKTLIIVHKEFLMNQWIERIQEFLPKARVGKIQGQVFDIADKDIVIGMIQTMYDKEFPQEEMATFGLTIVDEVHRIGSEQFSKTLLKTITHYMLGISATVDRKDGLTSVLHMFIGDKIYSEGRENTDQVTVRAIHYKTDDPEFLETEMDFRGQPKFSTMITKLCAYNRRSDLIVRVIRDLVDENSDSQIMVLAHNRCLLTYLYDAIAHQSIASAGYYVGGMKQADLQTTETKQIVLATYAMAAEALDIKTLSTLVMVTPKTDIIQSVGRILRVKHDNPLVIDIVDPHDMFQNQWVKRRRYYKKCNYRILQIDSVRYKGVPGDGSYDGSSWKVVFEPRDSSDGSSSNNSNAALDQSDDAPAKCLIDLFS